MLFQYNRDSGVCAGRFIKMWKDFCTYFPHLFRSKTVYHKSKCLKLSIVYLGFETACPEKGQVNGFLFTPVMSATGGRRGWRGSGKFWRLLTKGGACIYVVKKVSCAPELQTLQCREYQWSDTLNWQKLLNKIVPFTAVFILLLCSLQLLQYCWNSPSCVSVFYGYFVRNSVFFIGIISVF